MEGVTGSSPVTPTIFSALWKMVPLVIRQIQAGREPGEVWGRGFPTVPMGSHRGLFPYGAKRGSTPSYASAFTIGKSHVRKIRTQTQNGRIAFPDAAFPCPHPGGSRPAGAPQGPVGFRPSRPYRLLLRHAPRG